MSIKTAPFTTITYLDATEDGSLILQDTTFTHGGNVLYEGTNVNSICEVLQTFGFDSDNYMAGSTFCESPSVIKLFNKCIDICIA